jgi:trk system potassium uptake protein TrkA
VIGRAIADIPWPPGVTVAALVRDFDTIEVLRVRDDGTAERRAGHVVIAHGETVIESGDHVIVFCLNKRLVRKIEELFQVGLGFF